MELYRIQDGLVDLWMALGRGQSMSSIVFHYQS